MRLTLDDKLGPQAYLCSVSTASDFSPGFSPAELEAGRLLFAREWQFATAAGLGVIATFVPDDSGAAAFGALVPLPVEGVPTALEVGLVRRADDPRSPSTDELACWLRERATH